MYPDSPFAVPVGSFRYPVPLPTLEPDQSPFVNLDINCQWLPYIRGALKQLLLQSTWDTTDPDALALVQQRVFNLIDIFQDCVSDYPPFSCTIDLLAGDGQMVVDDYDGACTPSHPGSYSLGVGWQSSDIVCSGTSYSELGLTKSLGTNTVVKELIFGFDLAKGTDQYGNATFNIILKSGGVQVASVFVPTSGFADGIQYWDVLFNQVVCDEIQIHMYAAQFNSGGFGQVNLFSLQLIGGGPNPC